MTATNEAGTAAEHVDEEWLRQVREAAGTDSAAFEAIAPVIPAGYDELNTPALAALDFPRVNALAGGGAELDTAFVRSDDAPVNEWRFRVYRRGPRIPLADLLPLFDQLGVSVPDGISLDEATRDEVRHAFEASFRGDVEVDGFNRLVLTGGLKVREVEVVRAYARYLRQINIPFSQPFIESVVARHAGITR